MAGGRRAGLDIRGNAGQRRTAHGESRALPEAVPVALYAFDGDVLAGANGAGCRLLGFDPGVGLETLVAALDPGRRLRDFLGSLDAAATPEPTRFDARASDGTTPCLELHVGPAEGAIRMVAAHDCSRWQGIETQLQRRLDFERLLTGASARLIHASGDALDDAIVAVLGSVGGFFAVDRAYVFLLDDARGTQSNTHEWVADGISQEAHNLQDVPLDTFPWLMERLRARTRCAR